MTKFLSRLHRHLTKPLRILRYYKFILDCKKRKTHISGATFLFRRIENVTLGRNVRVNDAFFDTQERITIGDNVFFGNGVKILTGSHDYELLGIERQKAITPRPVVIEEGAWIASFAIILPGAHIGKNAVVGAGSVVKGNVEANTLVAGNPAKFIKRINNTRSE